MAMKGPRHQRGLFWSSQKYMSFPFASVRHFEQAGLVCGTARRGKSLFSVPYLIRTHITSNSNRANREQVHGLDRHHPVVCVNPAEGTWCGFSGWVAEIHRRQQRREGLQHLPGPNKPQFISVISFLSLIWPESQALVGNSMRDREKKQVMSSYKSPFSVSGISAFVWNSVSTWAIPRLS